MYDSVHNVTSTPKNAGSGGRGVEEGREARRKGRREGGSQGRERGVKGRERKEGDEEGM